MWVMLGEMFPNQIRGSALAVAGFFQWFANFLISFSFPVDGGELGPDRQLHLLRRVRGDQLLPGAAFHPRDEGQGTGADGGIELSAARDRDSTERHDPHPARPFRSREWFAAPGRADMAALYLERFMNYGLTPDELRSGKPIIGIAPVGLRPRAVQPHPPRAGARAIKAGIRDAGGIPMEFPLHPIFENCRRPTAALDRNLAYLGLVEILNGYPIDAVVLTTGCDKTTPAAIMAASTVDIPAITLSRRADARRLARRRAGRLGHRHLALAAAARRRRDRRGGVPAPRLRLARRRPAIATRWARPRR